MPVDEYPFVVVMYRECIEDIIADTCEGREMRLAEYQEALGRCALMCFGRFPYNTKYTQPRQQIHAMLSRVAFSVGVDELETEVSQGGLMQLKDMLQQWWQNLREAIYQREA